MVLQSLPQNLLNDNRFPTSVWDDDKENQVSQLFGGMKLIDDDLIKEVIMKDKAQKSINKFAMSTPISNRGSTSLRSSLRSSMKSQNNTPNFIKKSTNRRKTRDMYSAPKRSRPLNAQLFQTPLQKHSICNTPSHISRPKTPLSSINLPHRYHSCGLNDNAFLKDIKCSKCQGRDLTLTTSPDITTELQSILDSKYSSPISQHEISQFDGNEFDILLPKTPNHVKNSIKSPTLSTGSETDTESEYTDEENDYSNRINILEMDNINHNEKKQIAESPLEFKSTTIEEDKIQTETNDVNIQIQVKNELVEFREEQIKNIESDPISKFNNLRIDTELMISRKQVSIATQTPRRKNIFKRAFSASKTLKRMLTPRKKS